MGNTALYTISDYLEISQVKSRDPVKSVIIIQRYTDKLSYQNYRLDNFLDL